LFGGQVDRAIRATCLLLRGLLPRLRGLLALLLRRFLPRLRSLLALLLRRLLPGPRHLLALLLFRALAITLAGLRLSLRAVRLTGGLLGFSVLIPLRRPLSLLSPFLRLVGLTRRRFVSLTLTGGLA
jgi:hypothetical protein